MPESLRRQRWHWSGADAHNTDHTRPNRRAGCRAREISSVASCGDGSHQVSTNRQMCHISPSDDEKNGHLQRKIRLTYTNFLMWYTYVHQNSAESITRLKSLVTSVSGGRLLVGCFVWATLRHRGSTTNCNQQLRERASSVKARLRSTLG